MTNSLIDFGVLDPTANYQPIPTQVGAGIGAANIAPRDTTIKPGNIFWSGIDALKDLGIAALTLDLFKPDPQVVHVPVETPDGGTDWQQIALYGGIALLGVVLVAKVIK